MPKVSSSLVMSRESKVEQHPIWDSSITGTAVPQHLPSEVKVHYTVGLHIPMFQSWEEFKHSRFEKVTLLLQALAWACSPISMRMRTVV